MTKRIGNTLIVLLVAISVLLLSCLGPYEREAEPVSVLKLPAYHLMPFRAEFVTLFYETPERVGFQLLDGVFLYNYKEERLEADFALSDDCFEPEYMIVPMMDANEKSITIGGMNPSDGTLSDHYYRYDIKNKNLVRISDDVTEVPTLPYPPGNRQMEAFAADSWEPGDLRYYPMGSDKALTPFKEDKMPAVIYIMQNSSPDSPFAPKLTLMPDGRFQFFYSVISSYINYGKYSVTGTEYKMVTKDGQYTFVFYKEGNNLVFDAGRSASCILDDRTVLPDGTVFSQPK